MNNIEVKNNIEVCICGTTYKLTKAEAELLYVALGSALNLPREKALNYPEGVRSTADVKRIIENDNL